MALLIIGLVSAASIPMMTKVAQNKTGIDKNTISCITENSVANPDASVWYDISDGTTSIPASGTVCYSAVVDIIHSRGRALETAKWYANSGKAAEKVLAKEILRASCDQGGEKACDYFIDLCWKSGSSSAPYCDDTATFLDITYYLHQDSNITQGGAYIQKELKNILPKRITNLYNEVAYACTNNQTPDYGQNLNTNIACSQAKTYIQDCNDGYAAGCTKAYTNNWNRGCTQIFSAWDESLTGNYQLTYNGAGSPVEVYCNMTNLNSAAITGCGYAGSTAPTTSASVDCTYGRDNHLNQTCDEIFVSWANAPDGYYNLTENGTDPADPGSTECIDGGG